MVQLSVAIITYNEEKNIARCLDSVKGIADEIIVVDSFSTDKTVEICKTYGAKIIQHHFEGHIEQKNYALNHTTYNYVLSLDADEELSEQLRQSIIDIKSKWQCDAYAMNRLTNYCGEWIKHCGWYPDRKIRLFDKRKGKWGGVNPHDRFEVSNASSRIGVLNGDILHYSYYSISDHLKQVDYFTTISAKEMFKKKRRASIIKIIFAPLVRFLRDYFFRLGIIDGYVGFVICAISAHSVFIKYIKLKELYKHGEVNV